MPTETKSSPANSTTDIGEAVFRFNAGHDPERLSMKFAKMALSPYSFLRGACHVFYDALPDSSLFRLAPLAWCCGDLHFENFGSYKGDNRSVYFDINDFDEAALAPVTWDLVRLLTSIQCGTDVLNATSTQIKAVTGSCLDAYRNALAEGKPLWVERETSDGLVNELLTELRERDRAAFLDKRTIRKGNHRRLTLDGVKALPASADQSQKVTEFMAGFATTQPSPTFFEVLDVGRRIAGTGSLGVERFVVLVEGNGSPDRNYLIDIKEAKPSALIPALERLGMKQPDWADEACRVVTIQKRMQAVDHASLQAVRMGGSPFILRRLQPAEDRVAIGQWGKNIDRLKEVVDTMGRILAWDQLRACGRSGAASADELTAFAQRDDWLVEMMEAAAAMALVTRQQWKDFTDALHRREPDQRIK